MRQRKYTLPRHTNLAKQSSRIGAFLIDLAVLAVITLVLLYGCLQFAFNPLIKPLESEINQEKLYTHLFHADESGEAQIIDRGSSFDEYNNRIQYFYMNYLTGNVEVPGTGSRLANEPIKNEEGVEVEKIKYYTIQWYNRNILGITADDPEADPKCLFTYQVVDGKYNKDVHGVPKDPLKVTADDIANYMATAYMSCYNDVFITQKYVADLQNNISFLYSVEFVISSIVAGIVTYIVFPLVFKQGRTLGKKVTKLALANNEGYEFDNKQLLMRLMPFVVVVLSFLIPIWNDLFLFILIPLTIFLVSFALAMASPKRTSLHDFTARTIVVDDKTSIIFKDEDEEEKYLLKEDNLTPELNDREDSGEEPELRYEK